jgi:hypothetical protein
MGAGDTVPPQARSHSSAELQYMRRAPRTIAVESTPGSGITFVVEIPTGTEDLTS